MPRVPRKTGWLSRLYVPVATLLLLAGANVAVRNFSFDPLTAAQNPRLSFAGAAAAQRPAEGFALVRPLFPADDPNNVLTSAIPPNTLDRLTTFFLGNSQTIAIMDAEEGDELAPVWLAAGLNRDASDTAERFPLRLGSEPNLRMSELLVKCILSAADSGHRADVVVFGIVLDGLRWVDPREDVAHLARDPVLRANLEAAVRESPDLPHAAPVVKDILAAAETSSLADPATPGGARGAALRSEAWIQAQLDRRLPLFQERKGIYGAMFIRFLDVRNRVFGIRTDSKRPIPDGMYRTNLQLIEMTLRYLAARDVHAVAYFAPVRPIEPGPYEPADIVRFRRDLEVVCERNGALYFDYSNLIPEEMWTNYPDTELPVKGQRDFAHFTGRAHKTLGDRLVSDLKPWYEKWLAEKAAGVSTLRAAAPSADRLR